MKQKLISLCLLPILAFAQWEMDFDELWASSSLTAKDYVQDGLVAMWDGIENAGWGKHDPNATVWKDLIGENDIGGFSSETHFGSSYFITGNKKNCASFESYDAGAIKTVEIVIKSAGYDAIVIVCFSGSGYANRWFGLRANKTFNFAQRGDCATVASPTSVHYYAGTSSSELTDLVPFSALYLDGVPVNKITNGMSWMGEGIGGSFNTVATEYSSSNIYSIRLYERELTATEIAHNYSVDKARFGL